MNKEQGMMNVQLSAFSKRIEEAGEVKSQPYVLCSLD